MKSTLKREYIQELAQKIKADGFRVFISGSGKYGFFTDTEGNNIVCFGVDDLSYEYTFTKCYEAVKATRSNTVGNGWRLQNNLTFKQMINENAPKWATKGVHVKYTTLQKHLIIYQKSSNYAELF